MPAYYWIVSYGGPTYLKHVHDAAIKWQKFEASKKTMVDEETQTLDTEPTPINETTHEMKAKMKKEIEERQEESLPIAAALKPMEKIEINEKNLLKHSPLEVVKPRILEEREGLVKTDLVDLIKEYLQRFR